MSRIQARRRPHCGRGRVRADDGVGRAVISTPSIVPVALCGLCPRDWDRGPYERYPVDNASGHSEDCVRLAGEVERWRASGDEEG
jgi:hypothetical protein